MVDEEGNTRDPIILRGLLAGLELAAEGMPADDEDVARALAHADELRKRMETSERRVRRRAIRKCIACGSREMLMSKSAEFTGLVVGIYSTRVRFRMIVCRGCGRIEMFAIDPESLNKNDRFTEITAESSPDAPYR